MRNCFAKLVVDTGLANNVNALITDPNISNEFDFTLLYLTVNGKLADPVLARLLVRSASASPISLRVNGDTVIQHALNWQEHSYFSLHGAKCEGHDFRFGDSAATMVSMLTPQQMLNDAVNKNGDSIVMAAVLARSKQFFRALNDILIKHRDHHGDSHGNAAGENGGDHGAVRDLVHQLVNHRGRVGRTPLLAAANPHSILILASKVLTRHGNVGFIDATGKTGCQIDQMKELDLAKHLAAVPNQM